MEHIREAKNKVLSEQQGALSQQYNIACSFYDFTLLNKAYYGWRDIKNYIL